MKIFHEVEPHPGVPEVKSLVHEFLVNLFVSVTSHQDENGRYGSARSHCVVAFSVSIYVRASLYRVSDAIVDQFSQFIHLFLV